MRVLVERGAIEEHELETIARELTPTRVVVVDRGAYKTTLQPGDVIVRTRDDLACVRASVRPSARHGDFVATPLAATFRGVPLSLHRLEAALLYELVAAGGAFVSRDVLHARCWSNPTTPRAVDVAVCRLRAKLQGTSAALVGARALGYRLDVYTTDKRVLVIDDDASLHNTYRRALDGLSVSVDFATTFAAATHVVETCTHDAYFVDLKLPGGSGAELVALIHARNPRAPVMIVSGREDSRAIALSAKLGVPYAIKPCSGAVLEHFVERMVLARQPAAHR